MFISIHKYLNISERTYVFRCFAFFFILINFVSNKSFSHPPRCFILNQTGHSYCLFVFLMQSNKTVAFRQLDSLGL